MLDNVNQIAETAANPALVEVPADPPRAGLRASGVTNEDLRAQLDRIEIAFAGQMQAIMDLSGAVKALAESIIELAEQMSEDDPDDGSRSLDGERQPLKQDGARSL